MDREEMTEMEWTDDGEEAREANADKEFDEAISQALDATHEEMEAKQAEADEAAQERAEQRREKKNARRAKEKPLRNYEADRIAASARRQMERLQQENERLQRENDDFAQRLGYRDFGQMQRETGRMRGEEVPRLKEQEIAYQEGKRRFEEELRELNEHFPEADTWSADDFFALENAQEMVKMVQAGVPLYRAYAAYAADSIAQRRAEAAKRAALDAQSKEHLRRFGGMGSAAGGTMPQEVLEQYRLINPDATDAEILAHWRRQD